MKYKIIMVVLLLALTGCKTENPETTNTPEPEIIEERLSDSVSGYKKIHVYVALCDNENQGIVPVPPAIGNGKDYNNNLYWGTQYGVRTFFKNSSEWKLLETIKDPKEYILERLIFKSKNTYMVCDAYDGEFIKNTITDMIKASSGEGQEKITIENETFIFGGGSDLVSYVGHDGLMEFDISDMIKPRDDKTRDVIILACTSAVYFKKYITAAGANPLIWTTGLMSPEAYTLEAALNSWILDEEPAKIHESAAQAYNKYQKCGITGARNLFKTGF